MFISAQKMDIMPQNIDVLLIAMKFSDVYHFWCEVSWVLVVTTAGRRTVTVDFLAAAAAAGPGLPPSCRHGAGGHWSHCSTSAALQHCSGHLSCCSPPSARHGEKFLCKSPTPPVSGSPQPPATSPMWNEVRKYPEQIPGPHHTDNCINWLLHHSLPTIAKPKVSTLPACIDS